MNRLGKIGTLVTCGMALSACQRLDVTNPNNPTIESVFTNGDNLEAAIGTSFEVFWGVAQGARTNSTYPVIGLAALGEELTSADLGVWVVSQEPRVPLDNYDAGGWTNRKPWYDLYELIGTNTDALVSLNAGLKVGTVSATRPNGAHFDRAKIFSKMMQGLGHIYIGLLFDKGFVRDESMPFDPERPVLEQFDFKNYKEVTAAGIGMLEQAIAWAKVAPLDSIPVTWINPADATKPYTTADLIKIMNSYIARAMVYNARNAAERGAVDWNKVITYLDQGITTPFAQQATTTRANTASTYVQRTQLQTNARVDNWIVGPADTSGAFQAWLAKPLEQRTEFQVITPDRRIHGTTPTSNGRYIGYLASQTMTSTRGTYMWSRYRGIRYGTTYFDRGLIQTMTPQEMTFIRAEANYRLGNKAAVVTFLNTTRTANNLKAVTEAGAPAGRDCVPKREDGSCGDLFDALMYEKRIELFGLEAIIPFADWRGWGRLMRGSLYQFPVHGRELQTLGLPVYSFGGNLPGSAPDPTGPQVP